MKFDEAKQLIKPDGDYVVAFMENQKKSADFFTNDVIFFALVQATIHDIDEYDGGYPAIWPVTLFDLSNGFIENSTEIANFLGVFKKGDNHLIIAEAKQRHEIHKEK